MSRRGRFEPGSSVYEPHIMSIIQEVRVNRTTDDHAAGVLSAASGSAAQISLLVADECFLCETVCRQRESIFCECVFRRYCVPVRPSDRLSVCVRITAYDSCLCVCPFVSLAVSPR